MKKLFLLTIRRFQNQILQILLIPLLKSQKLPLIFQFSPESCSNPFKDQFSKRKNESNLLSASS